MAQPKSGAIPISKPSRSLQFYVAAVTTTIAAAVTGAPPASAAPAAPTAPAAPSQ